MLFRSANTGANPALPAWQALVAHQRWLRTVLLVRSGEAAAVDELFQELSLAVVQQPGMDIPEAKRPAWLYGIAVRLALQHRRRCGRRRRFTERYRRQGVAAHQESEPPLAGLLAQEQQRLLQEALQQLRPRDRELLVLKYTEGWGYVDLADHLGITTAAVEARLHRARAHLRRECAARQLMEVP